LPVQQKNIEKMIATFDDAIGSADAVKELQAWKELAKEWVINHNFLFSMKPAQVEDLAGVMKQIKQDRTLLQSLSKANSTDVVADLLQKKWIATMHPEVVTMLAHADDAEAVVGVLSKWKELMKLSKAVTAIPVLDLVCMGIEINSYMNDRDEIEKMRNQERADNALGKTRMHLWFDATLIWAPALWATWSAVYSMCTGLAFAWPWWWILIWGVVAAEAGKYAFDKWYYEVRDYYKQDKYDFAAQYRTEIKQAINASIVWASWDDFPLSLNEKMCEFFNWVDDTRKMQTLEDAVWGMIYLEEKNSYPLIANDMLIQSQANKYDDMSPDEKLMHDAVKKTLEWKGEELAKEKEAFNKIIEKRVEYIRPYLPWWNTFDQTKAALTSWKWVEYIENIIAESRLYETMKNDTAFTWVDIAEYKKRRKNILSEKNPAMIAKLDALSNNQMQYQEFIRQVSLFEQAWLLQDAEYAHLADIVGIVKEYQEFIDLDKPIEKKSSSTTMDANYVQIHKTLQTLFEWWDITLISSTFTEDEVIQELSAPIENSPRFNEIQEYSDSVFQNMMYRVAKEFHGYTGENDILQLWAWYQEDKANATWFYFDAEKWKRFVNNDNAIDKAIDVSLFSKLSAEEIYSELFKETSFWPLVSSLLTPGALWLAPIFMLPQNKDLLDTPTESHDNALNKEILTKIFDIIKSEKENQSIDNKKEVEAEIHEYIQQHTTTGTYVELPYSLIHDAARAWLWQLQYRYFSYDTEQWKTIAYTRSGFIGKPMHLAGTEKKIAWVSWELDAKKVAMIDKAQNLQQAMREATPKIHRGGRGDVLYDPVSETINSRGKSVSCVLLPSGEWKVWKDPTLYNTCEEASFVANIYNRASWYYKVAHTDSEFVYNQWYWIVNANARSRKTIWTRTTVISDTAIRKHIPSWKSKEAMNNVVSVLNTI
jgi:hypothetical protein